MWIGRPCVMGVECRLRTTLDAACRPPPKIPSCARTTRHLLHDVAWYGVLAASTMAFLSVYATRQGASPFQVALLTAGPAVVNLLCSIPFGRWMEGRPLVPAVFRSSLLTRLAYLLLIPIPALLPQEAQVWAVIALTVLMSVPGTLMAIAFNALFADLVPPDWRAFVVGRRNALLAVVLTATVLVCGRLLDTQPFPANYQWVFAIGAVGAIGQHLPPRVVSRPLRRPSARRASASPCSTWRGPGHCACSTRTALRPACAS